MSALGELAAAGATFVPELGETVAYLPRDTAPDGIAWRVARYDRARVLWRLTGPGGTYVDAAPDEVARLGRPHALTLAAAIAPLHLWDRDALRLFVELPAGVRCSECGRPHSGERGQA